MGKEKYVPPAVEVVRLAEEEIIYASYCYGDTYCYDDHACSADYCPSENYCPFDGY